MRLGGKSVMGPTSEHAGGRDSGIRFEFLRMRTHGHMFWVFTGAREFAALAVPFLSEGAALGERLMYVAENPDPADMMPLAASGAAHALQITSIAEVYGSGRIVDPTAQLATYAAALEDAIAQGYTGLRVAAENTSLVSDEEQLKAWTRWEIIADRFIAENPVTGLCAFDKEKVDAGRLRHLATLHPLSSASSPVPQFRLYSEAGVLRIEGQLDSSAVTQLWLALENLPRGTQVIVDLTTARLMSRAVLAGLAQLCESGVHVTIRGQRAMLGELRISLGQHSDRLVLQESRGAVSAWTLRQALPGEGVKPRGPSTGGS
jgi:ABC-type transporter Mla MlaB component